MSVHKNYPIAIGVNAAGSTLPLAASLATPGALWMTSSAGTSVTGLAGSAQGSVPAWNAATGTYLDSSREWAIATTSTAGLLLANTTAATVGVPVQYSPAIQQTAQVWATGGTNVAHHWRQEVRPASAATPTSALHWLSATDAGAYTSQLYVTSSGLLVSTSAVCAVGTTGAILTVGNLANGLGSVAALYSATAASPVVVSAIGRTDGASNVVIASVYDRNAALVTNASSMRNLLVSWTNNSDANIELIGGYYDGALWLGAGNSYSDDGSTATGGVHYGAGLNIRSLSGLVTIAAAATTTSTIQIPAGAVVLGVSCRVTTVIPTAATFTIGHAGSAALWGTGISTAAGTTNTGAAVPALFTGATGILITPNTAPANNTGRVRVVVHYYIPTAPTS